MIIVKLMGGNGNQMFQYAAGLALAKFHNTELLLDINYLLDKSKRLHRHEHRDYALTMFNISGKIASNQQIAQFTTPRVGNKYIYHLKKRIHKEHNVFKDDALTEMQSFYSLPNNIYLDGFWQNEKHFSHITDDLKKDFTFKNALPKECSDIYEEIQKSNSVCVMFRRGDFVNHPLLDVVGMNFYSAALKKISEKLDSPTLFIFSDDISWCQENFKPRDFQYKFVDQSLTGPNAEYYLQMIVACKHFIIPNSTFGWWGAWLSDNQDKIIITPKIWLKGQVTDINQIVPESWIAI